MTYTQYNREWMVEKIRGLLGIASLPQGQDRAQRELLVGQVMPDIDAFVDWSIQDYRHMQKEKHKHILDSQEWMNSQDANVWAEKFMTSLRPSQYGPEDTAVMADWFTKAMEAARKPYEEEDPPENPYAGTVVDHNLREEQALARRRAIRDSVGRPIKDNPQA